MEAISSSSAAAPDTKLLGWLFAPIDIASLVFFRIAFGLIMLWEVCRFFAKDWILRYYIEPSYHFTYYGFDWVSPWPGDGMYYHFGFMGLLALAIAVGFHYRIAASLFFLAFTYVFLLEKANYLNHFYLISLISFLMIFLPCHRAFSFDVWRRPALRLRFVPRWTLLLLCFQIALPYFFGGIAKINSDWMAGEPMRTWVGGDAWFKSLSRVVNSEAIVYFLSWGGMLFDLLIVPLLIWRRTRILALVVAIFFHLCNAHMFQIGIFPWFMIAATLLFLRPDWPRKIVMPLRRWFSRSRPSITDDSCPVTAPVATAGQQRMIVAALVVYVAIQLLMPLRHWLYPGDVAWTEEGHRYSWRMKLRDKSASVRFTAHWLESGKVRVIDQRDYLNSRQRRKMANRPDMIQQFAHHLRRSLEAEGQGPVAIRVDAMASLNGGDNARLIDPQIDLSRQPISLKPARWIVHEFAEHPSQEVMASADDDE